MKFSNVEKISRLVWIASIVIALSLSIFATSLCSSAVIIAVNSITWVALAVAIGIQMYNYKKSTHGKDTSKS